MPVIFEGRPGQVIALDDPAAQCTTRLLDVDPSISFAVQRSIVTRMTLSQSANVQFLHALGSMVHVYVFGDRMGEIGLSGLAFSCDCDDIGAPVGADLMIEWYKTHRVSSRRAPVKVSIGRQVFEGFVVGISEDVVDPSLSLVQWNLSLATLPSPGGDSALRLQSPLRRSDSVPRLSTPRISIDDLPPPRVSIDDLAPRVSLN